MILMMEKKLTHLTSILSDYFESENALETTYRLFDVKPAIF